MKVIKENHFRIDCTGREIYAFAETLGLIEDGEGHVRVTYGYDGYVETANSAKRWHEEQLPLPELEETLTAAERAEIADYMIARWMAWKDGK